MEILKQKCPGNSIILPQVLKQSFCAVFEGGKLRVSPYMWRPASRSDCRSGRVSPHRQNGSPRLKFTRISDNPSHYVSKNTDLSDSLQETFS